MFNRILVPLDGSPLAECVIPHLLAVAKAYSSEVLLLQVLDPSGPMYQDDVIDPFEWQIRKAEAETYLRGIAIQVSEAGLKVGKEVLEGKAAEVIINDAHLKEVDLILLSSHGHSGITGWNVSSVVQKIILRANLSVMIVRAYEPAPESAHISYRRVIAPLDGSQRAEFVLPAATMICRFHHAELVLAHVVKKPEIPHRIPYTQHELSLFKELLEYNQSAALNYLTDVQSHLDVKTDLALKVGDSVAALLQQTVDEYNADLVLMSAHGYTGETRWPYGHVVLSFVAYGTTPLMIMQDVSSDRLEISKAERIARQQGAR
ncbi:MAG: universal stress protein [Chloroflexi bacterium]|jgi:nucleotide-binding universal stress UspA family protein|nr:universal stress protein [Anaerolineaceae bacterium]NMB87788.1 universal stress protein [Chloroflexota bacterium]